MNYIDQIAERIYDEAGEVNWLDCDHQALYRMYAVLALHSQGRVSLADVHNAWSAWRSETFPEHRSLVPFDELSPEVQALDQPYVDAICRVAADFKARVAV